MVELKKPNQFYKLEPKPCSKSWNKDIQHIYYKTFSWLILFDIRKIEKSYMLCNSILILWTKSGPFVLSLFPFSWLGHQIKIWNLIFSKIFRENQIWFGKTGSGFGLSMVELHRSQLIQLQEPEYPFLGNWGMMNPNITAILLHHL
jgi:hypothetical protein